MYFFKIQRLTLFFYRLCLLALIFTLFTGNTEIFYTPLLAFAHNKIEWSHWIILPLLPFLLIPYTRKRVKKPLLLLFYVWAHFLALAAYLNISFFCFQEHHLFLWGTLSLALLLSPLCGFLFLPLLFFSSYLLLLNSLLWLSLSASLLGFFFLFAPQKKQKEVLLPAKK